MKKSPMDEIDTECVDIDYLLSMYVNYFKSFKR